MRTFALILALLIGSPAFAATVTETIGSNVDATIPRPPDGICRATFTMSSVGILQVAEETASQQLGLGPTEGSYDGFVYFATRTAAFNTNQYAIRMNTFVVDSTVVPNVIDSPDDSNTLNASHYNTFTTRWVSVGSERVAPCAAPNCVHFRAYASNVLGTDTSTGVTSTGVTGLGTAYDSQNTYIQYSGAGGLVRLGKFLTTNYNFLDSDQIGAGVGVGGLVADSTFVYGTFTPLTIKRWLSANIAAGETDFTPGFTTNSIQIPSISTDGFIYVPGRSAGVSPNIVYRVRASDLTITGTTSLGNGQFLSQVLVDEVNNKLYAMFSTGPDQQITRINRSTMATEATFVGTSTANGPTLGQAQIDVAHQMIYIAFSGSVGVPSRVQKVSLCS